MICNNCFACCDEERLRKRNSNRRLNDLWEVNWSPAHRGHAILCPKCSTPMQYRDVQQKQVLYQQVLTEFEKAATDKSNLQNKLIGKFGTNKLGLKWFVVYRNNLTKEEFLKKLTYWQSIGFQIVDFPDNLNKSNYLISEPIKKETLNKVTHFHCPSCQHTYDYSNDSEKYKAVQYWHSSEFNQV